MILKNLKANAFLLFLFLAIFLAYFFPQFSRFSLAGFNLQNIIDVGIVAVFFFYGLKLNWKELPNDLKNWRVHAVIQSITFILFPLVVMLSYPLVLNNEQWLPLFISFFFLATLPSTVSSSVVMVSIAKGNISSAIFNASISGLIGILLTPLWMSLFISKGSNDFDLSGVFIDLIIKIIVPVAVGGFLQPYLGGFYNRNKSRFAKLDQLTIILIVYQSFSGTFSDGLFNRVAINQLLVLAIGVIALFFSIFYFSKWLSTRLKFNREDAITVQFCSTKKSLVHGSVIGAVLFTNDLGLYLIPIMLYHTFQLLFISYKANRYAKELEII